jgi:hypothetical protein
MLASTMQLRDNNLPRMWLMFHRVSAVIAVGKHPVTFRTRKLSPPAPMVLHRGRCGRVGRRRTNHLNAEKPPHGVAFLRLPGWVSTFTTPSTATEREPASERT